MKKFVLMALLGFSTLALAESKTLFNLKAQDFANSIAKEEGKDGPMIAGRYDVGDVFVSTNLSRWKTGVYGSIKESKAGYISVDLKQVVKDWAVSIGVTYSLSNMCNKTELQHNIRVTAKNGKSVYINTQPCKITIENQTFDLKQPINSTPLAFYVVTLGDNIVFKVNGKEFVKINKGDFDELKSIEMDVAGDIYDSFLQDLVISSK